MTKQEFVDKVASKSGLSKRDAGAAVDAFLDVGDRRPEVGRHRRLHRVRQVHDPAARRAPGRQPAQPG